MTRPFDVHLPPEKAYVRKVLFAVEALDAVTLRRVTQGLTVTASGLKGSPIVNWGGLFVWLREDSAALQKVVIEPGVLPFEKVEIAAAQVAMPWPNTVELPPRSDYPFAPGVTGLRSSLIEQRVNAPARPQAVADAEMRLVWLDDDGVTWHDAPTRSHTTGFGDFVAILRLASTEVPRLDANGALSVRLRAKRAGGNELGTPAFALPLGRVADTLTYAWNELQP
jgi:hypothetical protein